jgi:intracellular multiplication protein IcmL
MSENEALQIELHKNTFFRDKYRKMMKLIVLMMVVCIFLTVSFVIIGLHQVTPKYFGSTTTGQQIPVHPLSDPVITEKLITQWASIAAKSAYHLDFNHKDAELANVKMYFTKTGWESFQGAMEQSGLMDQVTSKKLELDAVVTNTPVIKSRGMSHGVRYWVVEMPMLVSFDSASDHAKRHMIVTMRIVRSSDITAPSGLQIYSFKSTIA